MNPLQAKALIGTSNGVTVYPEILEIYGSPVHVKYGEGKEAYEGFKHECAIHDASKKFPDTSEIHNKEQLQLGAYNLVIEVMGKGKIKTKNHYVFNEEETKKLNKPN